MSARRDALRSEAEDVFAVFSSRFEPAALKFCERFLSVCDANDPWSAIDERRVMTAAVDEMREAVDEIGDAMKKHGLAFRVGERRPT